MWRFLGEAEGIGSGQQTWYSAFHPKTGQCREAESRISGIIQAQDPDSPAIVQFGFI